jgi:hypothetical protein
MAFIGINHRQAPLHSKVFSATLIFQQSLFQEIQESSTLVLGHIGDKLKQTVGEGRVLKDVFN